MLIPSRCFLFVLSFLVLSCSQRGFDSAVEEAKLLRRDAEWADLATAGKDIDKIVSYWSDDAVVIFPGQPVIEGKQAIRAYVEASLKTWFQNPLGIGKAGILARRQARLRPRH
jgi:SnoaL-like domain